MPALGVARERCHHFCHTYPKSIQNTITSVAWERECGWHQISSGSFAFHKLKSDSFHELSPRLTTPGGRCSLILSRPRDSAISRCFSRVGSGPPHSTQSNTRKQLLIDRIDHHGSISAKRLNVNRRDGRTTPLEVEDENPVQNLDSAPAALAM